MHNMNERLLKMYIVGMPRNILGLLDVRNTIVPSRHPYRRIFEDIFEPCILTCGHRRRPTIAQSQVADSPKMVDPFAQGKTT